MRPTSHADHRVPDPCQRSWAGDSEVTATDGPRTSRTEPTSEVSRADLVFPAQVHALIAVAEQLHEVARAVEKLGGPDRVGD